MLTATDRWQARVLARRRQIPARPADRTPESKSRDHRVYARRLQALVQDWKPSGPLMDLLLQWVGPDSTVIDVGAGTGRYTLPLAVLARRVFAVEPSPVMMGYLRENLAARGLTNIVPVAQPWEAAEVPAADFCLCSHVLYDLLEVGGFLRKLDHRARRGCFLVHHREQFDLLPRELWPLVYGEERAPMPLFDGLLQVLEEMGIGPVQHTAMPPPFRIYFASLEEVVEYALETLSMEDSPENRSWLTPRVLPLLEEREDRFWLPPQPASGLVWWLK